LSIGKSAGTTVFDKLRILYCSGLQAEKVMIDVLAKAISYFEPAPIIGLMNIFETLFGTCPEKRVPEAEKEESKPAIRSAKIAILFARRTITLTPGE
jgi:hypothetical protein